MITPQPPRLLHLTPHLGGGVGRALVSLARGDAAAPHAAPARSVMCLEPPEKSGAVQALAALGVPVHTLRDLADLPAAVARHDLVQCEFWNHPRTFAALARLHRTPARLLPWCHVSGLHFPRLPAALWAQPFPVALSAACSLRGGDPAMLAAHRRGQVHVISSAAGFERWLPSRPPVARAGPSCRFGYLGTLGAAKLHPDYIEWLAASGLPGLQVEMAGDEDASGQLSQRSLAARQPGLLRLLGFCHDVPALLERWDVLVYLLNPFHYGTAEIALLESMASEVVPIVGDHACERDVVRDGWNGWIVRGSGELSQALARCRSETSERRRMGRQASEWVRQTYTTARLSAGFRAFYAQALAQPKARIDWPALIGRTPADWFRSTLPDPDAFRPGMAPRLPAGAARFIHLERTKGSVHHFARTFPESSTLAAWSSALSAQSSAAPLLAA